VDAFQADGVPVFKWFKYLDGGGEWTLLARALRIADSGAELYMVWAEGDTTPATGSDRKACAFPTIPLNGAGQPEVTLNVMGGPFSIREIVPTTGRMPTNG